MVGHLTGVTDPFEHGWRWHLSAERRASPAAEAQRPEGTASSLAAVRCMRLLGGTVVVPEPAPSAVTTSAPGDRKDWRASRSSGSGCILLRRGIARVCRPPSAPQRSYATGAGV